MKEPPSHRMQVTATTSSMSCNIICHHLNSPERHYFHHKRPLLNFHYSSGCSYNHMTHPCSDDDGNTHHHNSPDKEEQSKDSRGHGQEEEEVEEEKVNQLLHKYRDNKRNIRRSKHEYLVTTALLCVMSLVLCRQLCEASWDQWWTYDGISGKF